MTYSPELAQVVEFGEAEAYADMLRAAPPNVAKQLGLGVRHFESALALTFEAADMMLFNRVMGLGLKETTTPETVKDVARYYKERGLKNFAIQPSPSAKPDDLPEMLAAEGFASGGNWAKVIRGTETPPAIKTDLRIEEVGAEMAKPFADVALAVFGMPPAMGPWLAALVGRPHWYTYLAFDGESPIATGALYIKNEIGWLGIGSTLPSHRGRGAQGAIMTRRVTDGIARGCRWLVTETDEETPEHPSPSYRNMVRTGFTMLYARPNFYLRSR
jgi:hypothetical protein